MKRRSTDRTDLEQSTLAADAAPARRQPRSAREIAALMEKARSQRGLFESQLDEFLSETRGFSTRVELLISALDQLPVLPDPLDAGDASRRPGVPGVGDDDGLRGYLRQLGRIGRMDKNAERRLARRKEFAQRRLQRAIREAGVTECLLAEVLGDEYSRSFLSDLDFAVAPTAELDAAGLEQVRLRAQELNRVRSEFVERCLSLVVDVALAYRTYGVPVMDLVQEGNGALIRAVEKFEWRKDVRFQTYATFWIRQAIERSIAFNKGIVRVPNYLQQKMRRLRREGVLPRRDRDVSVQDVSEAFEVKPEVAGHLLQTQRACFSLDVAVDDEGQTFASLLPDESEEDEVDMESALLRERLHEVLDSLSELEREILELRFGLDGQAPMTLEEVGQRMQVSRERIRQLQVRAIRKLQRPGLISKLAGFV